MENRIKKPIFILGCHKSGTTLLRNLLDGHPELFVIPFEAHFFQNTRYWVDYKARRTRPENLALGKKKELLFDWIKYSNSREDPVGDSLVKNKFDLEEVKKELFSESIRTEKDLFDAYFLSIRNGLLTNNFNQGSRFVEKSVENAEFALFLKKMHPDAQFIHIVRNPYSNIVSWRKYSGLKHHKGKQIPFYRTILESLNNSYYNLLRNKLLIKDYKIIKYEDLLNKPKATNVQLAEFLEIKFSDMQLKPTHFGELWQGNSSRKKKFQGISSENIDKWKNEITDFETQLINDFFSFVLEEFEYSTNGISAKNYSLWKKENKESLKIYIKNRLYVKMIGM